VDDIPTVNYGKSEIEYSIKRSRKRTTADVAIDARNGVVVTCPPELLEEQIHNVVVKKAPWILQKLKRVGEVVAKPPEREYVSGETYYYLGRGYRLKVIEDSSVDPFEIKLKQGRFQVRISPISERTPRHHIIPDALHWWYVRKAGPILRERVKTYASRVGSEPTGVIVKNQMKRWGSCTKYRVINLNYRIIMAPMSVIDYVVVHELVHLMIDDHSSEFWDRLRTVIPDFERRKEWLRINGPTLTI
jgi:predicted metal-dependent hydrolase